MTSNKLIYFPENEIRPCGGPAGYLYNLRIGLEDINHVSDVDFLPPVKGGIEKNARLRNVVPARIKDLRRLKNMLAYSSKKIAVNSELSRYDLIHFEKAEDLYFAREFLEGYKGKVVLTTHCPCAPHRELIDRLNPKDAERCKAQLSGLELITDYAFKRADYIVFPCREAEEPYFNTWPRYPEVRKEEKIRYLPTGIAPCCAKRSRSDVRNQYGIPDDAFLVCYVGRHNEVKGYPDLIQAAKCVLERQSKKISSPSSSQDIWFLIAGKEEPLCGLDDDNWIEAGWTDDPHSLIAASDVFVLPNRQTYFDLVLLEVLSLGIPVIASSTGGNKYFQNLGETGIFYFDNPMELADRIMDVAALPGRELVRRGKVNEALFAKRFSAEVFAEGYLKLVNELLNE